MKNFHLFFPTLALAAVVTGSCKGNAKSEQQKPAIEAPSPATKRTADKQWANGKVNEMNFDMFVERVAENNPARLTFNCPVPTVIDFYATWCGPCKKLTPIIETLAADYKGRVAFYHVDIDKEPDLASALGINAVPTLIFASGATGCQNVGFVDEDALRASLDNILATGDATKLKLE